MGKSTISMAIFNSYVKLPEGKSGFSSNPQIFALKAALPLPSRARASELRSRAEGTCGNAMGKNHGLCHRIIVDFEQQKNVGEIPEENHLQMI